MRIISRQLAAHGFPPLLSEIPDPPERLCIQGEYPDVSAKLLCVVGSRKYTTYGKQACEALIAGLSGYPVVIVSGLALGIDAIAHKAALEAGLCTIAVPGSGLSDDALYPRANRALAKRILEAGGCLVSPFADDFRATKGSFPERNRIMAGLSHATLIIEATEKSGTLITARLALDYNRDVLVVPGSLFSPTAAGPHSLLRNGATPVRSSGDILEALGIPHERSAPRSIESFSDMEKVLWEALAEPLTRDDLAEALDQPAHEINVLLTTLELRGLIKEELGKIHRLA